MNYILTLIDGKKFTINDEEYRKIVMGDGLLVLSGSGISFNKLSISSIYPESLSDEIIERKEIKVGFLHDGTRVKRYFGEWVDADTFAVDDYGKPHTVRIDPQYYPEIARDYVFTAEEYEKIKHLPIEERKQLVSSISADRKQLGFSDMKLLLADRINNSKTAQ